jgi:hypothetical protein
MLAERRRRDLAEALPSLPTLLRQLKLHDFSASDRAAGSHFRVRLAAAIALATRLGETGCASLLQGLMASLDDVAASDELANEAALILARAWTALGDGPV